MSPQTKDEHKSNLTVFSFTADTGYQVSFTLIGEDLEGDQEVQLSRETFLNAFQLIYWNRRILLCRSTKTPSAAVCKIWNLLLKGEAGLPNINSQCCTLPLV